MDEIPGTADGRPAVLQIVDDSLILEFDGERHGPRPIRGSVTKADRQGFEWIVGLGGSRVRFVPDERSVMTKALSAAMVSQAEDITDIARFALEMSPTFEEGMAGQDLVLDSIAVAIRVFDGEDADFDEARAQIDVLRRQHAAFLDHLAPRGWTHSRVLEVPFRSHVVAVGFVEKAGADPDSVDAWLAERVIEHPRVVEIINDIASCPVRAVWQWIVVAAKAAQAIRRELWGPAAFAYMAMAEGMWRDLRDWTGATPPRQFFSKRESVPDQRIAEVLSRARESLVIAHAYMSQDVTTTVIEPVQMAPTSRHGLLHGRVAGALQKVHAAKAFTLVDGILELAEDAVKVAPEQDLEPPPWAT